MKSPFRNSICLLALLLTAGFFLSGAEGLTGPTPGRAVSLSSDPFLDLDCTVIYAADGEQAYGGNNEDSAYPTTMVWFFPPEDGKYGMALFGYDQFLWQGGLNDQGLFFDGMAVSEQVHVDQGDKPRYPGSLPGKALAECADVACVKRMFEDIHAYDDWANQFLFGDAAGNSVIIEPTTMLDGGAPFQVATNFYQSTTDLNACYFCDRYWTARNLFEKGEPLSVDLIRDILDAVHLEDDYPTQYSTVYDLTAGMIYVYHFHNYENQVAFDLDEELAAGYHAFLLADLFPENPDFEAWAQPVLDQLAEKRAKYTPIELVPRDFDIYLGDYAPPEDYNALFDYYSVAYENGKLVLKMLPDKAWMELTPTSENSFFHVSSLSEFTITFLPDETGKVDQFIFHYLGYDYTFTRIDPAALIPEPEAAEPVPQASDGSWQALISQVGRFLGTNTFQFLAIILGLILLQTVLKVLRSLLI